jgi:hypothetical protein
MSTCLCGHNESCGVCDGTVTAAVAKEREELLKEITSYYHAVAQPHWPCDVCRTIRLMESIIKGRK